MNNPKEPLKLQPSALVWCSAGEVVPGDNTVLPQLVYHLFIFRSETSTPSSNDGSDYIFWERTEEKGPDLEEIQNYTLSIPTEYTDRFYLLLLHATPKQKPESVVLSGEGMTFTDSEISMVRESDNSYIPLSKITIMPFRLLPRKT